MKKNNVTKRPPGNSSGSTQNRLLFFLMAIALGIVAYLGADLLTQYHTRGIRERAIAIQDASHVVEQMRTVAKQGKFPVHLVSAFPDKNTVPGANNLPDEELRVSYADPKADPLDVIVTVTWSSHGKNPKKATLRSYVTQR